MPRFSGWKNVEQQNHDERLNYARAKALDDTAEDDHVEGRRETADEASKDKDDQAHRENGGLAEACDQPGICEETGHGCGENALVRNCALSRPTPKVPMTFGIATLAIVLAKTITKNAINATVTTMPR